MIMARVFVRDQTEERRARPGREPTESGRVTENIQVSLWVSEGENGEKRIHWGVGRHNPNGKPYRTFHPSHLQEFPQLIATLAGAFATSEDISPDLREKLGDLAHAMEQVRRAKRQSAQVEGGNGQNGGILNV
jgi:hypothetical protein